MLRLERLPFDSPSALYWVKDGRNLVSRSDCLALARPPPLRHAPPMCNLYSLTKGQAAIIAAARAMTDRTGNLPPMPGIFPDYAAPIVRNAPDGRELTLARWGLPSPVFALKGKSRDPGVTNVRNTASPHWRRWLGPEHRCLVPFTSFSEPEPIRLTDRMIRWDREAIDAAMRGVRNPGNSADAAGERFLEEQRARIRSKGHTRPGHQRDRQD